MKAYLEKTSNTFVGLSIDATKVAPFLDVNTAFGVVCGEAAPNHCQNLQNLEQSYDMLSKNNKATEIKCCILTVQSCPANVSPFKIIAARPQTTNQRCNEFNLDCMLAVDNNGINISVAFDGLCAEQKTVRQQMLNFLEGKSPTVGMIDPNHVSKAIRSQLVLGGSFTTVGDTCFDVGLLQLAGVQQNLYRVDDFSSDSVVLELCNTTNISKIEKIVSAQVIST